MNIQEDKADGAGVLEQRTHCNIKCPDGHLLHKIKLTKLTSLSTSEEISSVECDVCGNQALMEAAVWGCTLCDFDLCQSCWELTIRLEEYHWELTMELEGNDARRPLPAADELFHQGNWERALEAYRNSLTKWEEALGTQHHCICSGKLKAMARTLYQMEDLDNAYLEASKALAMEEEILGSSHPVTKRTRRIICGIQQRQQQSYSKNGASNKLQQEKNDNHPPQVSTNESTDSSNNSQDKSNQRDLCDLGVSVHYLQTIFMSEVLLNGHVETSTIYEIEDLQVNTRMGMIRRKGEQVVSPVDGRVGAAYVHCLKGEDTVGPANYMLSYSWGYSVGDIVDTLVNFCVDRNLDPKKTYIWIDVLCINQHRVVEEKALGGTGLLDFEGEFPNQLRRIGCMLAMMTPWNNPLYLQRAWCIFEIFTAHEVGCELTIVMPLKEKALLAKELLGGQGFLGVVERGLSNEQTEESAQFLEQLDDRGDLSDDAAVGIRSIYDALANTCVQQAKASIESDRVAILNLIKKGPGFDKLNHQVNDLLRNWVRGVIEEFTGDPRDVHDVVYAAMYAVRFMRVGWLLMNHYGDVDAARDMFTNALSICADRYGLDSLEAATCYCNIGATFYAKSGYEEALLHYNLALAIRTSKLGPDSVKTASVLCHIGSVLVALGNVEEALQKFLIANEIFRDTDQIILTANSYDGIGNALESLGDFNGALEAYCQALSIREANLDVNHVDTAASHNYIGGALAAIGDHDGALSHYYECLSIRTIILGAQHTDTAACHERITALLQLQSTEEGAA